MVAFRRILSIPMWLTAIALAWVLGRQAGVDGMTFALVASLAVALVLWTAGSRQRRGLSFGWVGIVGLVVIAGSSVAAVTRSPAGAVVATDGAEPFTEARLATLRRQGKPVFVYFTADWCLTCKVNEKSAIDTTGVRSAFERNGVAVLVGDWTDGDATLGRFIQAHNRAGVPLYLFYPKGARDPQVLPQLLTKGMLTALR